MEKLKKLWVLALLLFVLPGMLVGTQGCSNKNMGDKLLKKVKKKPNDIKLRLLAGDALMQEERFKEAHEQYDAATKLVDKNPKKYEKHYFVAWNNKGTALYKLGETTGKKEHFEDAIDIFKKLLEIPAKKKDSVLHSNIAHSYHGLGMFDESKKWFEKALQLNSGNKVAYSGYAVLLQDIEKQKNDELKDLQKQADELAAALESGDAELQARLDLARILLEMERHEESAAHFDMYMEALEDQVAEDVTEDYLNALFFSGRYEDTLALLRELEVSDPENSTIHARLGRTLFTLEQYAEALDEFNIALELDPKNKVAIDGLAELEKYLEENPLETGDAEEPEAVEEPAEPEDSAEADETEDSDGAEDTEPVEEAVTE